LSRLVIPKIECIESKDSNNLVTDSFSLSDLAFSAVYSKKMGDSFAVGIGAKMVQETIEKSASAFGLDLGLLLPLGNFGIGAGIRNLGLTKLKFEVEEESLPQTIITFTTPNSNTVDVPVVQFQFSNLIYLVLNLVVTSGLCSRCISNSAGIRVIYILSVILLTPSYF
jgi:hypothetical protein